MGVEILRPRKGRAQDDRIFCLAVKDRVGRVGVEGGVKPPLRVTMIEDGGAEDCGWKSARLKRRPLQRLNVRAFEGRATHRGRSEDRPLQNQK